MHAGSGLAHAKGQCIIAKSGGFGQPDTLVKLAEKLHGAGADNGTAERTARKSLADLVFERMHRAIKSGLTSRMSGCRPNMIWQSSSKCRVPLSVKPCAGCASRVLSTRGVVPAASCGLSA